MYMDKRTLVTVKETVYKGYIHACDIITVYKLTSLDIRLDILIFLNRTLKHSVLIYNCIYIRLLTSTKDTCMKMYYKMIGWFIICFKRNRCRNFIILFKIKRKTLESQSIITVFQKLIKYLFGNVI